MSIRTLRIKGEMKRITACKDLTVDMLSTDEWCVKFFFLFRFDGPAGCVYENLSFEVLVEFGSNYPIEPPHVYFKSPVYHPNIDGNGRICLEIIQNGPKGKWNPIMSVGHIIDGIKELLCNPGFEDPLIPAIANEHLERFEEFEKKARALSGIKFNKPLY